jgi:hypothetical protein
MNGAPGYLAAFQERLAKGTAEAVPFHELFQLFRRHDSADYFAGTSLPPRIK